MVWDCVFCRTIYLCSLVAKLWEIKCSLFTYHCVCYWWTIGHVYVWLWWCKGFLLKQRNKKLCQSNIAIKRSWTIWELWGISGETNKSHEGEERKLKLVHHLVIWSNTLTLKWSMRLHSSAFMRIPTEILNRLGWGMELSIQKSQL